MKLKRILSRLIRIAVIIVAALLVMIGAGFGLLQTGAAKRLVARELTDLLGKELGPGSAVSEIKGLIPFNITVGDIRLCDQRGDWLQVENFVFRFSPSQLLRLRVRIDELSAARVDLKRLPESKEAPAEKKQGGGGFPDHLPNLELTRLSVRELILGKELAGERTILNLTGSMDFNPDTESLASLKITGAESPVFYPPSQKTTPAIPRAVDGENISDEVLLRRMSPHGSVTDGTTHKRMGLHASIEGRASGDLKRLNLDIEVSEGAGGILARIIELPQAGPISIQIHGEGPTDRFQTDLEFDIKKVGSIRGSLNLNIQQSAADGEITLTVDKLDSLSHLTTDPISGALSASLRLDQRNGIQDGSMKAKITDLAAGAIEAAETVVSLNLKDIVNSPSGELSISITGLNYTAQNQDGTTGAETAGIHILFSGPRENPNVDLILEVNKITFPSFPLDNPDPFSFSLEAHLKDTRFGSKAELTGRSDMQLQSSASGPAKLTLSPFSFKLPPDGEIEGKLTSRINLGLLASLEELSRQSLTGILFIDLSTSGTIQKPVYIGRLKIENGEYQNLNLGTVLTDLKVDVEMDHTKVIIRQFEANDIKTGKLAIDGNIALSPEKNFPFSSSLTLSAMELANTDDYLATISGKIIVSGNTEAMDIKGGINVDGAGFRIPKTSPPSVVGIPVIEINKPGDPVVTAPPGPSPLLNNINLGLTIKATDQISVSGRGLSSTWGADLTIDGTASAPTIKGGLKLSSGYFLFLGKRLELADCSISLAGGVPLTPQININAQATSGGILINLQIVGSPDSPKLILTSEPPHPPDEILARLLFGAEKASLTAMEGARLAYGLQVLQGGSDIIDYLTGWTSFLGGPQLNLTQYANDPNVTAVSARWELAEDISVENQKSLAGSGDLVIFYLDLTRRIQFMTIAGVSGAGDGARIRWHYDF